MKTCIVTFQSAYNYGAILQNYALQKYIEDNFGEVVVLNYHNKKIDDSYKKPNFKLIFKNPKHFCSKSLNNVLFRKKNKMIDMFRNKFINLTKYYDKKNIFEANNEADIFVTGSDQVWNYLITGLDDTYYLAFTKDKITCSYAASFGISKVDNKCLDFYRNNLKKIDYISVREIDGNSIVKELINRDSLILPDPTMLINMNTWENLCIKPKIKKKYILVYKITKSDKLLSFAKKISKKTCLPIIYIPNDMKDGIVGKPKFGVGPQEWLGYIKNAEYVITNSFHGTVFSIIFGKKFFVESSSKVNVSTSRLNTLLKNYNLENRLLSNYNDLILNESLDEISINKKMNELEKASRIFLNKIYNGDKNGK